MTKSKYFSETTARITDITASKKRYRSIPRTEQYGIPRCTTMALQKHLYLQSRISTARLYCDQRHYKQARNTVIPKGTKAPSEPRNSTVVKGDIKRREARGWGIGQYHNLIGQSIKLPRVAHYPHDHEDLSMVEEIGTAAFRPWF